MTAAETEALLDGDGLTEGYGLFVGGEWVDTIDGAGLKTVNPATEEVLADVTEAGPDDVDRAVAAARKAYRSTWSRLSGAQRRWHLLRVADLVEQRSRELAVLQTLDTGRPIRQSRDVDLPSATATFYRYAGWADKLDHAGFGPDPRPHGVTAQILPAAFPMLRLASAVAPALACGNTVVLKPADASPLVALAFADICLQAELPPGVVNIVTGSAATGRSLAEHPAVDKIAFAGSVSAASALQRATAGTRKSLTLALRPTATIIVAQPDQIDPAISGIVRQVLGEPALAAESGVHIFLPEEIAPDAIAALKAAMSTVRLGDPLDPQTDLGPVATLRARERLEASVQAAEAAGATRWSVPADLPGRGWWFAPTILTGLSTNQGAVEDRGEPPAGPVVSVHTYRNPEELIDVVAPHSGARTSGSGRDGALQGLGAYLRNPVR